MSKIKFGTDGWRARMDHDYTPENVRLVAQAVVDYLKNHDLANRGAAVGYDNRKNSEKFAQIAAEVCSGAGIKTYLTSHSVPSPVLSYSVKNMNLGIGIMITASHNPAEWNGFKIKEYFGGSSFPETTKEIEANLQATLKIKPSGSNVSEFDPDPEYLKKISSLVDLELIKSPKLRIVIDAMHGSGAGYFKKLGLPVTEIRGQRDVKFGGVNPEPIPVNLVEATSFVCDWALKYTNELVACIVLDGDADRLSAIDSTGRFINTHNVFCLLLCQLAIHRKLSGEVVKTFNLSNLIDLMCKKYQRKLTITPIGFKHIARLMLERDVMLGGEESGGMGIKGFIPERDGILAGLMLLELMVYEKKNLAQILEGLMKEHGYFYYDRIDLHTEKAQGIVRRLIEAPPNKLGGMKMARVETLDGLKLNFEDASWILFRASGTEPLLRIYAEGRTPEEVKLLLAEGEKLTSAP